MAVRKPEVRLLKVTEDLESVFLQHFQVLRGRSKQNLETVQVYKTKEMKEREPKIVFSLLIKNGNMGVGQPGKK